MKVFILFILTCCTQFAAFSQSTSFYYYNKKFKRVENQSKATYSVYLSKTNEPSKVIRILDGKAVAEGVLFPTDTLTFDGKAIFFDDVTGVKAVKFYKRGIPEPPVAVDKDLKKTSSATPYYVLAGENGEFCAYYRTNPVFVDYDFLYASGKILDTISLALDGQITFYTRQGDIGNVKIYQNGQELPFVVSTLDYKEPYENLGVVTYAGGRLDNIDLEMAQFIVKCKRAGADGVVGVKTSISSSSSEFGSRTDLVIQGTIIRLKKKKEGE